MKRMKRFILAIVTAITLLTGFAGTAMAVTATSAVTVTIPEYIAIEGLNAITVNNIVFSGAPAIGASAGTPATDSFTVEANVAVNISAAATTQPTTPGWVGTLAGSTDKSTAAKGSTVVVLTASVSGVTLDVDPGNYTGGVITVTVTKQ